ncbi:EAL domain-containing protein [Aliarcobacter cibarius]|jgi:diguanylate cyclase (GGDEF)-like protein/PAS domain S-box-containing protein|uniref:Diguanylate cyclase/phosphodiesterase n=1 Tax=Aliarcobacter cibarius TaxID=255507 RepID=A0A7L5JQP0_9BACT|nr:EAL domain-containing protein [Aliarcobacter cibarius]QKJ27449.1 diguanylate cyclase/phosphodiesterase [Aliarcobacter cibarius]TLS98801.1 EAL domain-containing protein [Aliarcobacter cibarius]TLS99596.1 EAL domain-containing protein [Aliarcobacter cibarius]TLT04339.1 EAL domain-containing protein [Aliarcobacter cibarius]
MNRKNKISFLKYFEPINIILFLFIIVTALFIYNINQTNEKIKNFNFYYNNVVKLKILYNEFNSFVNTKATFINYDSLISKMETTEKLINALNKEEFYKNFSEDLKLSIEVLDSEWKKKVEDIERFKSVNASIVGSINYILSLSSKVKLDYMSKNPNDILIIDDAISSIFRLFVNDKDGNSLYIKDHISNLEKLALKYNNSDIDFLTKRVNSLLMNLKKLNRIEQDYFSFDLRIVLDSLDKKLDDINQVNISKQKKLSFLLFISSTVLLLIFVYVYIKSIKTKDELIAFRYAVENSYNAIVLTDKNRLIKYVNEAFEKATGYSKKEAIGQNPRILKSGSLPREFYDNMNEILDRREKWTGEFINKNKDGEIYYENASITPIIIDNDLKGYLAIKLNVSDYIKEKEKVEFLAYHDSLTLLLNRRALQRDIVEVLNDCKTNNKKFTILFIDLDGFKFINDGLGHDIGDILLKEIAYRLANTLAQKHNAYRLGGDEFAIIFEYKHVKEIEESARNIIKKVNEKIFINKHSLHVGCSIGIAKYPVDGEDYSSLMKHSDTAMYKAKQNGKNRYEFYTKDLTNIVSRRFEIEQALAVGLKNDEFYVVYQPKYSLKTKKIYSVEALLRWNSSTLGNVTPEQFVPIAEEIGFIYELGLFVFKRACEDFVSLKEKLGLEMISINVSVVQLMQDDFMDKIENILNETKVDSNKIGIELTETYLIKNVEDILDILIVMRRLGFKILIDDFGTGYSSLKYLQQLPIDILKIDKSFVKNLTKNNNDIVKAIVAISKSFGFITIAEGVETKEQEELLIELDVDIAQGYLYSKPKRLIEFN